MQTVTTGHITLSSCYVDVLKPVHSNQINIIYSTCLGNFYYLLMHLSVFISLIIVLGKTLKGPTPTVGTAIGELCVRVSLPPRWVLIPKHQIHKIQKREKSVSVNHYHLAPSSQIHWLAVGSPQIQSQPGVAVQNL